MTIFSKQTKPETIIYTVVWFLLFMAPLVELLFYYDPEHPVWIKRGLTDAWGNMLAFLIAFLIHNHILAPMLVIKKRVYPYIIGCVVLVAIFQTSQCMHRPDGHLHNPGIEHGAKTIAPPPHGRPPHGRPPIDKHDISMFTIIIMMLGANLGVKSYFQSEEEKKRLAILREQSLKQELDYLRYQINPHFIMNTLNNIHALVDIDPEQAKDSIVDMSKMMRYLLYESDKHYVTLNGAIVFLKKYINLMKLRYTDMVSVNLTIPENSPDDIVLVPLVFIPFVENAFKHGVTYNKPSVIDIEIRHTGNRLLFHCHNTKSNVQHEHGGVGLNNVTKRLDLIYHNDYSLDIDDGQDYYDVTLNLPARRGEDFESTVIA